MRPVNWKELVEVCRSQGFVFDRQRGDHYIMTKAGSARPVVIPQKSDLSENISFGIARTIGISKKQLKELLDDPKARSADK